MELFEHCRGCMRYLRSCTGMSKEVCEQHNLRIPITNADRIRGMSDEGLAETMLDCFAAFYDVEWSKKDILDWLKQEVKE